MVVRLLLMMKFPSIFRKIVHVHLPYIKAIITLAIKDCLPDELKLAEVEVNLLKLAQFANKKMT